ncbi:MAG: signal peptidase I [Trichloromonas sp.]|jgi:signal peptidase I|nr:signal peptidase I [Trichloromonas sp.]
MSKSESSAPAVVKKPWYREYAEALFVAAILALIIRSFVVQAFKIPSGSMEDTLLIGDHLLVNKFLYGVQIPFVDGRYLTIRHPERGDVIVFEFPEDEGKNFFQRRDFIKRIVGLPGDTVEVLNKKVLVNGEAYHIPQEIHKEDNVVAPGFGPRDFMPAVKVPEGHYFVMGDNRDRSYDSRFWGFVEESKIKGLAFIKYWSWDSQASWLNKVRWNRLGRPIE